MASPPESLRLFDIDHDPSPSRIETKDELSHLKTQQTQSQIETSAEDLVLAVRGAAKVVADAERRLVVAIEAARAGHCTWREIGIAAGIPYQTLHRRHHQRQREAG